MPGVRLTRWSFKSMNADTVEGGTKTSLEIEVLKRELELKAIELELKNRELQDLGKKTGWRPDPVVVGISAALIGFLGNVVATFLESRSSLQLENAKHEASRLLETDKARSSLILEAIKTGDPEKAAQNIEFFLAAGLIEDQSGKIGRYIADRRNVPVLPSASGITAGEPVDRLPLSDAARNIASAVGLLAMDQNGGICTAWIVSKEYVITADYCVTESGAPPKRFTLRMGFLSDKGPPTEYPVEPNPIEIDEKLGYAILKVNGNPAERFGTIRLTTREPVIGEALFILHHSAAKPLALSRGVDCRVTAAQSDIDTSFGHTCDTLGGSGGAPVIAASDQLLLGLHHSGAADGKWNVARRFSLILRRSRVLRDVLNQGGSPR